MPASTQRVWNQIPQLFEWLQPQLAAWHNLLKSLNKSYTAKWLPDSSPKTQDGMTIMHCFNMLSGWSELLHCNRSLDHCRSTLDPPSFSHFSVIISLLHYTRGYSFLVWFSFLLQFNRIMGVKENKQMHSLHRLVTEFPGSAPLAQSWSRGQDSGQEQLRRERCAEAEKADISQTVRSKREGQLYFLSNRFNVML